MVPNMRMSTMVWGVLPFVGTLMLLLALVFAFPEIALWLPRVLMQ
jgi:TRAP-type C4-dicarboxylate transport system permease large subunit